MCWFKSCKDGHISMWSASRMSTDKSFESDQKGNLQSDNGRDMVRLLFMPTYMLGAMESLPTILGRSCTPGMSKSGLQTERSPTAAHRGEKRPPSSDGPRSNIRFTRNLAFPQIRDEVGTVDISRPSTQRSRSLRPSPE